MKCGYLSVVMLFTLLLRLFQIRPVGDLGIGTCVLSKYPHCAEGVLTLSHLKMPPSSPVCASIQPSADTSVFLVEAPTLPSSAASSSSLQVTQATLELTTLLPLSFPGAGTIGMHHLFSPTPFSVTHTGSHRINPWQINLLGGPYPCPTCDLFGQGEAKRVLVGFRFPTG